MLPRNLIKTIKTINIHRLTSFQPTSKAYITNIPTIRTYTTKNGSFSSKEILITEQDVIDDFTNPSIFQQNLTNDIQQWKQDDTKAAWIHLKGSKLATLLPSAMEAGFTLHHAKDDKIALCKWLDETVPNKIPPYAVSSSKKLSNILLPMTTKNISNGQQFICWLTLTWLRPEGNYCILSILNILQNRFCVLTIFCFLLFFLFSICFF